MGVKRFFITFSVCLAFLIVKITIAEEPNNIKLSYKIIESYSEDQKLTMVVRLRAKNTYFATLYGVVAKKIYTHNVTIDKDQVYLGDIAPGDTIASPESFSITMTIESSDQEPPQTETIWSVEYSDINGDLFVEEVWFQ
jgi:hypothetical protein